MHTLDLSRRFGEVSFQDVTLPASAVVGEVGGADDQVERQLELALIVQSAELIGTMESAFEMTVDWAFNRYSFGRPLASYQELKHRFADMKSWLEASHAIGDLYFAPARLDARLEGLDGVPGKTLTRS